MVTSAQNGVVMGLLITGSTLIAAVDVPLSAPVDARPASTAPAQLADPTFHTADRCLACHKGVTTSTGRDVSIGYDWRASMMANSARDPYWHAAVRREVMDYPEAGAVIEQTCSRCHMPMANVMATQAGRPMSVFAQLPVGSTDDDEAVLAADGVSCAVCHQISPEGLGGESSFEGGFEIDMESPTDGRRVYGPFEPDAGGEGIMHSATGFRPTEGSHIQTSELCASCHTLFTHAVRQDGGQGPEFPEQVPYLEWQASTFAADGTSCQDCHMPEVGEDVPVTAVLGRSRPEVSRHVFRGGNFFMLRMLNRYRGELGVAALPQELALAAERTEDHLREMTAEVVVVDAGPSNGRLTVDVDVRNLAGHKFPTAYPSRRAWIHLTVSDATGVVVFESGAFRPDGSVTGSDSDLDARRYEPHYDEITRPDQVQVYQAIMVDGRGDVTTGLMSAERWAKDNRLLPLGFDPAAVGNRIRVHGGAVDDPNFAAGGDRVRYSIDAGGAIGPFVVTAELWFQPIGYRWAENLSAYSSFETERFVRYYRAMAAESAVVVATGRLVVE